MTKKTITKKPVPSAKYNGNCPVCRSENVEQGKNTYADSMFMSFFVECLDCKATWEEDFKSAGYHNLKEQKTSTDGSRSTDC
jgi:transposase-like protein